MNFSSSVLSDFVRSLHCTGDDKTLILKETEKVPLLIILSEDKVKSQQVRWNGMLETFQVKTDLCDMVGVQSQILSKANTAIPWAPQFSDFPVQLTVYTAAHWVCSSVVPWRWRKWQGFLHRYEELGGVSVTAQHWTHHMHWPIHLIMANCVVHEFSYNKNIDNVRPRYH